MSVINTMLKELEKREIYKRQAPYATITHLHKKNKLYFPLKKIFLIALIVFITTILLSNFLFTQKKSKLVPMQSNPSVNQAISTSYETDQVWIKPVSITGVTLQVKENITEITFLLDHVALYRLISNEMQNQISLVINRSQLQAELPPVNYLSTAIQAMTKQIINGDTKFTITLLPGATIKYVNMNDENSKAELVIAIEYQSMDQQAKINSSDTAVKVPAMRNLLNQQYQNALLTAEAGNYQTAIQHLTSLIKIDPSFKDARMSLVALLIDQGNALKAKKIVNEGLNDNPDYIPFIELKARILVTEGKPKEALTLLQTVSPRIDEDPDYHAFIAALYEQTEKFSLAANLYQQLVGLNPNNGSWWFGLGLSLDKLGKSKDALSAYNKAAAEGHLNPESLAYLQNRLQNIQEAMNDKE